MCSSRPHQAHPHNVFPLCAGPCYTRPRHAWPALRMLMQCTVYFLRELIATWQLRLSDINRFSKRVAIKVKNNSGTPTGDTCTRAYGLGSQCRPNECIFGSGKPWGVGILGRGVYEPGEGNEEVSLRATWERGGQNPVTTRRVPIK